MVLQWQVLEKWWPSVGRRLGVRCVSTGRQLKLLELEFGRVPLRDAGTLDLSSRINRPPHRAFARLPIWLLMLVTTFLPI